MRPIGTMVAASVILAAAVALAPGCAGQTAQGNGKMEQIGQDARKALKTTGQVIEGAAKGAIEAVEKK